MLSSIHRMKQYILLYIKVIFVKRTLMDIDAFYRNIVSELSYNDKINYCESLVFRTQEDLKKCKCKLRKIKLKQLLKVSTFELKKQLASSKQRP